MATLTGTISPIYDGDGGATYPVTSDKAVYCGDSTTVTLDKKLASVDSSIATNASNISAEVTRATNAENALNQNLAGTGMQLKRWEFSATSIAGGSVFVMLPSGAIATVDNCSIISVVCKTAGYLAAVRPMLTTQGHWTFTLVDNTGAVKASTAATFVIVAGIVGG